MWTEKGPRHLALGMPMSHRSGSGDITKKETEKGWPVGQGENKEENDVLEAKPNPKIKRNETKQNKLFREAERRQKYQTQPKGHERQNAQDKVGDEESKGLSFKCHAQVPIQCDVHYSLSCFSQTGLLLPGSLNQREEVCLVRTGFGSSSPKHLPL